MISDSKIITRFKILFIIYHHIWKKYQKEVWCLISSFKDFGIKYVPRINNVIVDILANATAKLAPLRDGFSIDIIY